MLCIAASGAGNTAKMEGIMDYTQYQQSLEANIPLSVKKKADKRMDFTTYLQIHHGLHDKAQAEGFWIGPLTVP